MYHLLVNYFGWESDASLSNERVFENTRNDLIEIFKPEKTFDQIKVSKIPALFVSETGGPGLQLAKIGYIRRVNIVNGKVKFGYNFDEEIPPIPNDKLETISTDIGIERFELSRTHWSIKDIDLFRMLLKNQLLLKIYPEVIPAEVSPKVFNLSGTDTVDKNLISVMMPFAAEFDQVYELLRQIAEDLFIDCLRADDIWENDAIIQDVFSLIYRSRIVICDCTGRNANVFYEAGIAHTLGRDVILITQNPDDIPFDLRHLRFIPYLNNNEGREELYKKLTKRIKKLMKI